MDGWKDREVDGLIGGLTDWWMGGWMDEREYGRKDEEGSEEEKKRSRSEKRFVSDLLLF